MFLQTSHQWQTSTRQEAEEESISKIRKKNIVRKRTDPTWELKSSTGGKGKERKKKNKKIRQKGNKECTKVERKKRLKKQTIRFSAV